MKYTKKEFKHARNVARLLDEKYHLSDARGAAADIERLYKDEPLDYVIGWTPFLGTNIDLSLHPFIPRPETEYWTKKAIEELKAKKVRKSIRILDMFSGSGCIGIAVLRAMPKSHVTFVEKNTRFVKQIQINIKKNGISKSRFCIIQSDIFENARGRFDAILANPPYVGARSRIEEHVRRFEPKEAYWGGKNGFRVIRAFLKEAKNHLLPGGTIWMEHGAWQVNDVRKTLAALKYPDFSFHRDQYGRPRYLIIRIPPSA